MSLEDETAAMKRLVERGEARAGHLESHHGKASIVIDKHDLDAMRDIKARLEGMAAPTIAQRLNSGDWPEPEIGRSEGMAAPGETAVGKDSSHTEREADWFAFFCRKYVQRSDARQKESGLQYTEAETHDLAKECARHEAELLTAAPGETTERAPNAKDVSQAAFSAWLDGRQACLLLSHLLRDSRARDYLTDAQFDQRVKELAALLTVTEDGARRAALADVETEITRLWFERSTDGEGPELDDVIECIRALATEATPGEGGTDG